MSACVGVVHERRLTYILGARSGVLVVGCWVDCVVLHLKPVVKAVLLMQQTYNLATR